MADRDSAAKRRRDRRLRMHWRHEQLSLQMALAAALHHSRDVGPVTNNARRSQRTARAGVRGREMTCTAETWDPSPTHPHTHTPTHPPTTPAGVLQSLRRRARRGAAVCRVRTARPGAAALRAADCRHRPFADSR